MIDRQIRPRLTNWRHASLAEVNHRAPLLDRQENKYLISAESFDSLLDNLSDNFDVLAIDDRTVFSYETVYYDTDEMLTYNQHAQGKRRRMKIRSRRYVDSDLYFFEIKLKGTRGRTIKKRVSYDAARHGAVDREAMRFVATSVDDIYGESFAERLDPKLTMRYRRVTLVGRGRPERVTADFGLEFSDPSGASARTPWESLIIEVKSADGRGHADAALRDSGERPARCSKYCIGLNMVRSDLRYNTFKRPLVGHFGWSPAVAAESEHALVPVRC